MRVHAGDLHGLVIVEPDVFRDDRGSFQVTYERRQYLEAGIGLDFVQDNFSRSARGTLRGLHYQIEHPQGKLVQVVQGEVYDVVVDLRRHSHTFGRWSGIVLSEENRRQLYVPPGFAHGFLVTSEWADFLYKCTDFYSPEHERTLRWDDPQLAIDWPLDGGPLLSNKDRQGKTLAECETFEHGTEHGT
ncbi:MAG: dTDP-4-dehydrorhamnose 3,5-epimerase [Planctomycetaceae bacterium]